VGDDVRVQLKVALPVGWRCRERKILNHLCSLDSLLSSRLINASLICIIVFIGVGCLLLESSINISRELALSVP